MGIGWGPQPAALVFEKPRGNRREGFGRLELGLGFVAGGVLAELYPVVEVLGGLARLGKVHSRDRAEVHPAVLITHLVLGYEGSRSALAQAQAEAGNVVVKFDVIRFAGWQPEGGNLTNSQFHLWSIPVLGRSWEDAVRHSVALHGRIDSWSTRDLKHLQAL